MEEKQIVLKTADGVAIALWKMSSGALDTKHVFLTHGTFSNKTICDGIASYLVAKGYTCWIMEWRSHGNSSKAEQKFNFETVALYDVKTTFEFLLETMKIPEISCVVHSGGGIVLTLFLLNNITYQSKIKSISLFGVQAFGAAYTWQRKIKIVLAKYVAWLLGGVPAKYVGSTEENETYHTMKQWFNWNLAKCFKGANGRDYLSEMPQIQIPILSFCAKGDTFIAPKYGCKLFLEAFKNNSNTLLYCSTTNGYLENYNHGRILKSQNSKKELWPIVASWMAQHATHI